MRLEDVQRVFFGSFVQPGEETGTGAPRVEAVYGYVVRHSQGIVVLDTGLGDAGEETEAWYRPRRIALPEALSRGAGIQLDDVAQVVNCHLTSITAEAILSYPESQSCVNARS